jgi:hypothetical protein
MIPIIYDLAEAARILGFSESYLRAKLRDRTFAGMKRAGSWAMTEAQIEAAIESMCIDPRAADPPRPSGLSKHSRFAKRLNISRIGRLPSSSSSSAALTPAATAISRSRASSGATSTRHLSRTERVRRTYLEEDDLQEECNG